MNEKEKRKRCQECGSLGASLGGENPSWWRVRGNVCISCFAKHLNYERGVEEKEIQKAYARRKP